MRDLYAVLALIPAVGCLAIQAAAVLRNWKEGPHATD